MGMVLPEGVLNNKNLAAVREYFEGRAKLILICSIPQNVFIAAGATVKPSLAFMRKFTAEEEAEYAKYKQEAIDEVTSLHQSEIDSLNAVISDCDFLADSLKNDLKDARSRLKQAKKGKSSISAIEAEIKAIQQEQKDNKNARKATEQAIKDLQRQIEEETKPVIKKKFNYDIPIAKIEDAGITTTGAASEGNQLPTLVEEYKVYRIKNALWRLKSNAITYGLNSDSLYCRNAGDKEVVLNGQ